MMQYIGTKVVRATPMSKFEYNEQHARSIAGDDAEGYLVHYQNAQGIFEEKGYFSWSPKDVFEEAYKATDGMTYGLAVEAKKKGLKVARSGWNGAGQWVIMMPALHLPANNADVEGAKVNERTAKHIGVEAPLDCQPYFVLWTAQGKWQPGWVPSTSDVLAEDWMVVS